MGVLITFIVVIIFNIYIYKIITLNTLHNVNVNYISLKNRYSHLHKDFPIPTWRGNVKRLKQAKLALSVFVSLVIKCLMPNFFYKL